MQSQNNRVTQAIVLAGMAFISSPAFAQISKVNTVIENVMAVVLAISVAVFTICIALAGYRMAFQQARFADVAPILLGGMLVGGAGGMASWLLG